jgi:hypothetical protein
MGVSQCKNFILNKEFFLSNPSSCVLLHHVVFRPYWYCNADATSTTYCKILGQKILRHGNKVISFIHWQVSSQDPIGTAMLVQHQQQIAKFLVKKIPKHENKVINLINHQASSQHSCCFSDCG